MPGEAIDYLIGMVITGIIAVSAVVVVPNLSYVNLFSVDQQQLRNVASGTLKTMLLDAGYPSRWGSRQDFSDRTLQRFGLALDSSSSFYVLDPDKVCRLILDNPTGHLGYDTIKDRLKLQGYGFNFKILPPFNVTVNDGKPVDVNTVRNSGVRVRVTYNDGSPISNALVKSKIMYTVSKDTVQFYWATPPPTNTTDAVGKCTVKNVDPLFQSATVLDFILIIKVTVANVATFSATYNSGFHQQVASASIIGDTVTLWIPENSIPNENPRGERRIMDVVSVTEDGASTIYTGDVKDVMNWGEGYSYWTAQFPGLSNEDSAFLIFNIRVSLGHGEGLSYVLFLGPRPNWLGARIQSYGDATGSKGASSAVKIQRDVVISGMSYISELTLWKES